VSDEDIAIIREQYEATNRRDFGRVMELYADDVTGFAPLRPTIHSTSGRRATWGAA
jgi:ketosteroid isomerase-like protein